MLRLIAALAASAAACACAQGLFEMDPQKIQAGWHREKLEEIRSEDPKERAAAARWLGGRKDAESIAALAAALKDPEAKVRYEAASGLWSSEKASEPARAALVASLEDADPNVVAQAAGALQSIGMKEEELAAARKRVLDAPQATPHSRYLVARNLVGFEEPTRLLPHLLAFLERAANDRSTNARNNREAAQRSLTRLVERTQSAALVAPLREAARALKGGNDVVVKVLGKFEPRPEGHLEFALAFLDARDPALRLAALDVLRETKEEPAVAAWAPKVAALLRDPSDDVRSRAAWTLGSAAGLAAPQSEALVAALADPSPRVRRSSADALGYVGEGKQAIAAADRARVLASARPALQSLAERDPDGDVKRAAAESLRRMAWGEEQLAAAAPAPGAGEAGGMAVLRARKIAFEPDMFQRALYEGDVEVVRAFLDAGMSAKAAFPNTGTPLWVMLFDARACNPAQRPTRAETKAVMRLLLERGADPNLADAHGNVPLMAAATRGCDREVMRMLLKAGARVDAKNSAGLTPFEFGLIFAHDGLEELLAAGYRLPPDKAKAYREAYADRPAAQVMIRKATAKK